jgi:transcriptional regulator with XRE-family HTH domain
MRLRQLRKNRGWTQVRMAEEFGIDRSYISDMERGKKNVCLPTMEVLAQGFGVSLAQLVRDLDRERRTRTDRA